LVDCRKNRILDGITTQSKQAQTASRHFPSVKTIGNNTPAGVLFSEFQDLTRPSGVPWEVSHNTIHLIKTTPGLPVSCRPRCLVPDRLAIAKVEFDAMLRDGTARRSDVRWSSAIHLVPNRDNGWRPCGDYMSLNARTIPDCYPVRHIHDYFLHLAGYTVFLTIHLVRAYHQIPVYPADVKKTAITIPLRLFEFPFMSFGLRNARKRSSNSWTKS